MDIYNKRFDRKGERERERKREGDLLGSYMQHKLKFIGRERDI